MNNTLKILSNNKTMSSLEIAKLTGKPHNDVLKDIRRILEEAEIGAGQFSHSYLSEQNKPLPCFNLPFRETNLIISGYSAKHRLVIIDRWQELESIQIDPMQALNDPATMRSLLLGYSEKVLTLESSIKILEPKAIALDRLSSGEGSQCITDAAKALKVRPRFLFKTLQALHWIYKRAGGKNWLGYQDKIQQGLIEHKLTTVSRSDGSEKIMEQALLTPKGMVKLSGMLSVEL
jgi:phage antirepressor YoqD-like protein/phage regulator Rha-like protein